MNLVERIEALAALGKYLNEHETELNEISERAFVQNRWFTVENCLLALQEIKEAFLDKSKLLAWTSAYNITDNSPKKVALILAGNIPAVGFHDVLSVFIAGHTSLIKFSSKDSILIPFLLRKLEEINPQTKNYFQHIERLTNFDAVIATGSNNTSLYFEQYFSKYPHIIRKNRHSVGVIYKDYSLEEIKNMGADIFQYFGLGCRNISKLFIEEGTNLEPIMEIWHEYNDVVNHSKYINNYDYNYAVYLLNKEDFLMNGALMLKRDESIHSRIASVHYTLFEKESELLEKLHQHQDDIQCVISQKSIPHWQHILPGQAQKPALMDYADGVDVLDFLTKEI